MTKEKIIELNNELMQLSSELSCGVYKYVYHGETIYIGRSHGIQGIPDRIYCHRNEEKFWPYLDECKIYYVGLPSPAETHGVEPLLINKYKPLLCCADKYDNDTIIDIEDRIPDWKDYHEAVTRVEELRSIIKSEIKRFPELQETINENSLVPRKPRYVSSIITDDYVPCEDYYLNVKEVHALLRGLGLQVYSNGDVKIPVHVITCNGKKMAFYSKNGYHGDVCVNPNSKIKLTGYKSTRNGTYEANMVSNIITYMNEKYVKWNDSLLTVKDQFSWIRYVEESRTEITPEKYDRYIFGREEIAPVAVL